MKLQFAELLSPLFLGGTNLGLKLNPKTRSGLSLEYNREFKELHVTYNGVISIIPTEANVNSMEPEPTKLGKK